VGGFEVRLDDGQDVTRGEGVEVQHVFDGDFDGFFVHADCRLAPINWCNAPMSQCPQFPECHTASIAQSLNESPDLARGNPAMNAARQLT
jgi:hypothetical protein